MASRTSLDAPSPGTPAARIVTMLLIALGAGAASWADEPTVASKAPLAGSDRPAFMSGAWGGAACAAWNKDPVLTTELAKKWIRNDKGRGYKVLQLYRSDCGDKPTAELRIALKEDKAECVYGGPVETATLDKGADYVMSATTERWKQMGAGEYGAMKAMMLGRLQFSGPYGEAMGNMGPFGSFLLLAGKVEGSDACP
jgi:putative sterol carrier protein